MYKLVISDDEGKTTIVPLIRDQVTIGRKEGNTIRLTERNVSRFHAKLTRLEEDFVIEDLGSLCGTKVNATVLRTESAEISTGDQINIGDYSLSIRTDVASDVPLGRQMGPGDEVGIGKVTPHARLVVVSDPEPGREVELTADLYVIGRSEEANFRVDDASISRAHARVDLDAGEWTISDLDSINGIRINGIKKDDYVLRAGDVIELGSVQIRFVAPGEPYDYVSPDGVASSGAPARARARKSPRMLYLLAAVGVVAVLSIVIGLVMLSGGEDGGELVEEEKELPEDYESLMERGKDEMQAEEWVEAARIFERALQKKPGDESAGEMKAKSIKEADAQKAFASGLAAGESKDWKEAVARFAEIPRSSHYYDIEQLRKVAGKLCSELLDQAELTAQGGDLNAAEQVLDEVGGIPEAPPNCRNRREQLRETLKKQRIAEAAARAATQTEGEAAAGGGAAPAGSRGTGGKPPQKKKIKLKPITNFDNPYD